MDFNFFNWIRDGVRQSVLLGVSDAVDQIGAPDNSDAFNEHLAKHFSTTGIGETRGKRKTAGSVKSSAPKRKRLGRSLKEIEGDA